MSEDNITVTIDNSGFSEDVSEYSTSFSADASEYTIDLTKYSPTILGAAGTVSGLWGSNINTSIGANGTSSSNFYGTNNFTWSNSSITNPSKGLQVTGNAEFEGDVKIKGVSIVDSIDQINKRLAILVPDPNKLAHFEALKRAYENYKTLEALCELPTKDE